LICGTLVLLIFSHPDSIYHKQDNESAGILFYNVENLFDTHDDSLTDDDEFLPGGPRGWNKTRYRNKINSIARVIIASGEWELPALIGLCEVENRRVLEDLIFSTTLSRYNFGIVHNDSPDPRGIDVGLLYRKDIIDIEETAFFKIRSESGQITGTREMLFAACRAGEMEFNIIVCHLPSRRGGVLETNALRMRVLATIRQKVDSINSQSKVSKPFILMGDFNTSPDDPMFRILTSIRDDQISFVNLNSLSDQPLGTYKYQGQWEQIDQVYVSADMVQYNSSGIKYDTGTFRIVSSEFLLNNDENYTGLKPFSTFWGYRYTGGFSDHLPVFFNITSMSRTN